MHQKRDTCLCCCQCRTRATGLTTAPSTSSRRRRSTASTTATPTPRRRAARWMESRTGSSWELWTCESRHEPPTVGHPGRRDGDKSPSGQLHFGIMKRFRLTSRKSSRHNLKFFCLLWFGASVERSSVVLQRLTSPLNTMTLFICSLCCTAFQTEIDLASIVSSKGKHSFCSFDRHFSFSLCKNCRCFIVKKTEMI